MPVLYAIRAGTRISLAGERLEVSRPPVEDGQEETVQNVPLRDVDHLVLGRQIHITMPALATCLERGLPVIFMDGGTDVLGLCVPTPRHDVARRQQYRLSLDATAALTIARQIVQAKVLNGRRVLQRLAANRPDSAAADPIERLKRLAEAAEKASSVDILRGVEGASAGIYFATYGGFFPDHCPFEYRSRRPPHNAPNAVLSYAYTLLAAEAEAAIWQAGLDPCIGFYHEPEDRRPALALDLIEPYRAPLADALALDLISHKILDPDAHFEERDGGVFLNREGKARFFLNYEKRMTREFQDRRTGLRTTLRTCLQREAQALRLHLMEGRPYEPFVMP